MSRFEKQSRVQKLDFEQVGNVVHHPRDFLIGRRFFEKHGDCIF